MSADSIHILMTGGGAPGAPGILHCLQQEKSWTIHLADADPEASGRYLADHFTVIPAASHPDFIPAVLKYCQDHQINVILPLVTRELIPFANAINTFKEKGIHVLVSPAASLDIANNKSALYQFLQWRDIPVPAFRVAETVDQFKEAVEELGYPAKPVCFKPSVSNGSRGFRVLHTGINEHDWLFNQKPNSRYIQYEDACRILSSAPFPELLVSEYLPGDEYSVDCLCNHGESRIIVPRLRIRQINGISVRGQFVDNEEIKQTCKRIINELKLHGNIGIQLKADAGGKFQILEINPRVQGSISTCLGAGVNLPVLAIRQELGLLESDLSVQIRWGSHFSRYWSDINY